MYRNGGDIIPNVPFFTITVFIHGTISIEEILIRFAH